MQEYLKEQNMRREKDPVSSTLDVGSNNNNQLERESHSSTSGSEDTENENFWVTDGVRFPEKYIRDCESERSWSEYEDVPAEDILGFDGYPNNTELLEYDQCRGICDAINDFFSHPPPRNDNEFNNNETVRGSIAGECVNQLDVCKNEEKIFYEKPKLNIQTVTYLYDSVLTPTVKCMNYVNSIKASDSLENLSELEENIPEPEVAEIPIVPIVDDAKTLDSLENYLEAEKESIPEAKISQVSTIGKESLTGEDRRIAIEESFPRSKNIKDESAKWAIVDKNEKEIFVDVEIVELTKSVKEIIQFPEIEEITEIGKSTESIDSVQQQQQSEEDSPTIEHIDLIREAKELSDDLDSKNRNIVERSVSPEVANSTDPEKNDSRTETFYETYYEEQSSYSKIEEIDLLSSIGRDIGVDLEKYVQPIPDVVAMESVKQAPRSLPSLSKDAKIRPDTNKLADHDMPEVSSADTRKKEKMARNQARRRQTSATTGQTRRPDKRRADNIADGAPGGFDVYNIETAMPKIDLDAIESHLRAAREEERREKERVAEVVEAVASGREPRSKNSQREDVLARFDRLLNGDTSLSDQRRNDREEIRRRLAMGPDAEDLRAERGRKPSLQSRLQSGMNLQICFMNETPSDTESPSSENDASSSSSSSSSSSGPLALSSSFSKFQQHKNSQQQLASRPQILSLPPLRVETGSTSSSGALDEADFFARQARLQTEARMALAQAKEMAHMQMEVERQRLKQSPITEMVRSSLEKVGVRLGEDRRRLSRVLLTELNVAQLQVVANDLHARIAMLNEALVEGLLRRDDLHMEQDSMLVDVEDLTRYLGAKQETLKKRPSSGERHQQNPPVTMKNRENRVTPITRTALTREKMIKCLPTRRRAA